jgi:4'-phosphopantetheinyl transferase
MRILGSDERRQAGRFHFDLDKKRFVVGRGILRILIGNYYLGVEPSRLEFSCGPRGKPYLARRFGDGTFQFNRSDSHMLAIYAFAKGHEVGVDIEHVRTVAVNTREIADGFFSEREKATLRRLPDRDKEEGFFNCWTRKEAYLKAIGEGLYVPLDQFDVSLTPGEKARLLRIAGRPQEASRWSLKAFVPETGYKAVLAVRSHDCNFIYRRFPLEESVRTFLNTC